MYDIKITARLQKKSRKLDKKDPVLINIISNKIDKIALNPFRYKFLSGPLSGINRVHIQKHFVLIFEVDEANKTVTLLYFDHHDNIY